MSLLNLWKDSPEQFENKQVHQIIGFAADGVLHNESAASLEFRELLGSIPVEFLLSYANDCLERSFTNSGFALQDIINEVGRRLGFEVEGGLYRGIRGEIGFDGLWSFPSGHNVVVEVKTTDTYRVDIDRIAEYRRRLISDGRIDENQSSILIVVGRDDTGDLEAQIRGSRHAWDVRLISISSLFRLLSIKDTVDDPQIVQRICEILIPKEFTRLDHIVDIVFSAAEDASEEEEEFEDNESEYEQETIEPSSFSRSEKSVAFHGACVQMFANHLSIQLNKKSRTTYESRDKSIRVVSLVSKDYERLKENPRTNIGLFWFGYRAYHREFAESTSSGYLILGCGSPDDVLAIGAEKVAEWVPGLNSSTKRTTSLVHWHFHITKEGDRFFLERKRGFERVDITEFRI